MGLTELHLYIGSAKKCVESSGLRKSVPKFDYCDQM